MSTSPYDDVCEKTETQVVISPTYQVIFHNDDYTTFDFVIKALMDIFHKSRETAEEITLTIHNNGKGIVGIYSEQVAYAKMDETMDLAKAFQQDHFIVTVESV